jgi:hypothetical protein
MHFQLPLFIPRLRVVHHGFARMTERGGMRMADLLQTMKSKLLEYLRKDLVSWTCSVLLILAPLSLGAAPNPDEPHFFGVGSNEEGQLGLGALTDADDPTSIGFDRYVDQISGGALHSLFIDSYGSLNGMGLNVYGQLGFADLINRSFPTYIPTEEKVSAVSAGGLHSLFISASGKLWGMGLNDSGQLGQIPVGSPPVVASPVWIPAQSRVISASAGLAHSLFVTEDGQLWGMGNSEYGQLGFFQESVTSPVAIATERPVVKVVAGTVFSLYLTDDGRLWIMGSPDYFFDPVPAEETSMLSAKIKLEVIREVLASDVVDMALDNFWMLADPVSLEKGSGEESEPVLEAKGHFSFIAGSYIKSNGDLWVFDEGDYYRSSPDVMVADFVRSSFASLVHRMVAEDVIQSTHSQFALFYVKSDGGLWGEPFQKFLSEPSDAEPVSPILIATGVAHVAGGGMHLLYALGQKSDVSETFVCSTLSRNCWDLDPDGKLGDHAVFTVQGSLPGSLKLEDGCLKGYLPSIGNWTIRITADDGVNERFLTIHIRVIEPTKTPVILGVYVNGVHQPVTLIEEATHARAAVSELMHVSALRGEAFEMRFEWDWVKDPFSFRTVGGSLPEGLILDGETGVISGVPSESGEFIFVVSIKDWRGRGYQWVRLVIE